MAENRKDNGVRCCILDPTGNITALVESPVPAAEQPAAAAAIMARHPQVEQVGFLRFPAFDPEVQAELLMAGGEFCGNASMSAAALCLLRGGIIAERPATVKLRVSGAARPVSVTLRSTAENCFAATVEMPPAIEIAERDFSFGTLRDRLRLVRMEGISHLLIPQKSCFFALKQDPASAEKAVRSWCAALEAEGLGLMFLEGEPPKFRLTPLVYIPGSDTVFWENSCASGSSAVGMALATERQTAIELTLEEPGGSLRVESDPASGRTLLHGAVRLLEESV